ncbi:MAG: hypothetical protein Q9M28_05370 [Mariprofundaceae bacterium]|nr:hypothetical protein [Mariprofundaceae bacterium]
MNRDKSSKLSENIKNIDMVEELERRAISNKIKHQNLSKELNVFLDLQGKLDDIIQGSRVGWVIE